MIGVDARLIKVKKNSFMISYNKNIEDKNIKIKSGHVCKSDCLLIVTRIIELGDDLQLRIYNEYPLCPEISHNTEKNWSFFKYKNEILFSYGLSPSHVIYSTYISNHTTICNTVPKSIDQYNYYGNYEVNNSYNDKKLIHISVSTPAIKNISNDKYIGVGHLKYLAGKNTVKKIRSDLLKEFYIKATGIAREELNKSDSEDISRSRSSRSSSESSTKEESDENYESDEGEDKPKKYKRSIKHDYFMFLYEFDPSTGEITATSDMFIPESSEYLLVFPTGLIYVGEDLWIFYGDHDSYCKTMIINQEYVSKMLKPTPKDNTSFHENDIKYFTFPESCIKKNDIFNCFLNL